MRRRNKTNRRSTKVRLRGVSLDTLAFERTWAVHSIKQFLRHVVDQPRGVDHGGLGGSDTPENMYEGQSMF